MGLGDLKIMPLEIVGDESCESRITNLQDHALEQYCTDADLEISHLGPWEYYPDQDLFEFGDDFLYYLRYDHENGRPLYDNGNVC